MTARLLDGRRISKQIRAELAAETLRFNQASGIRPHLAAVLVGANPASEIYVQSKRKACEQTGLSSSLKSLPASTTQEELLSLVNLLNRDSTVHGILLQLPLPPSIDEHAMLHAIDPIKDVDAFHPCNVGLIAEGRPRFLPCTPAGIIQMLLREKIETKGANVVIVGRSSIVGRPLSLMLSQKGPGGDATVTVCHSHTRDLPGHLRQADIVIAAIGKPEFVKAEMVKPGAVVIDVGINRKADGKVVGDVDFAGVSEVASAITPVPGGVGPMTISMLMANTLTAAKLISGR